MTGPLTLANGMPTESRHATSKAYVDSFLAYATGMPIGAIAAYGGAVAPPGWLKCDGAAVSRTTYAALFAAIGTIYGAGDNSTTFNLPDLRDQFVRGKSDARAIGSKQAASLASHTHTAQDPGHNHTQQAHSHTATTISHSHGMNDPGHVHGQAAHTHALNAHTHGVSDPGHAHTFTAGFQDISANSGSGPWSVINQAASTAANVTGISIVATGDFGMGSAQPAVQGAYTGTSIQAVGNLGGATTSTTAINYAAATGLAIGATGGTETVPANTALDYYIKAVNDGTSSNGTLTGIGTSDANMINIDETDPVLPVLDIQSDVAYGIPKLDAAGKIKIGQLPASQTSFMGFFDASPGVLPSGTYNSGAYYTISIGGTLELIDPITFVSGPIGVVAGEYIQYVSGSVTNPDGWYYTLADSSSVVTKTSNVGSAIIPAGSTGERDVTPSNGFFRYNTTEAQFEGYTPGGWGQVGGLKGPLFSASTASQGTVNGALLLQLNETIDIENCYSAGRFTPNVAGYYWLSGSLSINVTTSILYISMQIRKNGSIVIMNTNGPYANLYSSVQADALIYMNGTTDYVEFWQDISATGTAQITTALSSGVLLRLA
jgi:microcystin-dependent protein